jgi:hypothetical protein
VREALSFDLVGLEAARLELPHDEIRGGGVARLACAAVRLLGRYPCRQPGRLAPVEQDVRRQSLGKRTRAGLEREHRQHQRQERRDERSPVDTRLDQVGSNLQFRR